MPNYWVDHIHVMSQNPLETAEFYEEVFGARRVSTVEFDNGRVMVNLDLSGTKILVSRPGDDSAQTGLDHFGLGTDNLEAAVGELKAKGVEFTQDVTEVRPGFKISFLLAPQKVSIELQEGNI